jgi:hypothetical protein
MDLGENLLSLSDAAKSLPRRPHISTLHRWRLRGVRGIKLETVLVGGARLTSQQALQRFCDRVTAAANGEPPPQTVRTPAQRERDIRAAERELSETGI